MLKLLFTAQLLLKQSFLDGRFTKKYGFAFTITYFERIGTAYFF